MKMFAFYWKIALLLTPGVSFAATPSQQVTADVVVTRLATERWRVDYTFNLPISGLIYGPPIASYREQAWHILNPEVELIEENGREMVVSRGQLFSSLSIEVDRFTEYAHDNYAPLIPFSDGGAALYLGFFTGAAIEGATEHSVDFRFQFEALPSESVISPSNLEQRQGAYAYFGKQEPVVQSHAILLLDPATPGWLRDSFIRVTESATQIFADRFGYDLPERPLVIVGAGELSLYDGYSVKGGAVGGQLVMLLRGRELTDETDEVRAMFEQLTAHELAHLWQLRMLPAGFNGEEPWLHEGGAEAMAVQVLGESNVWNPDEVASFGEKASESCRAALGDGTLAEATHRGNWDAVYACGFGLFRSAEADPISIWSALVEEARREGSMYTQRTLDRVLSALSN